MSAVRMFDRTQMRRFLFFLVSEVSYPSFQFATSKTKPPWFWWLVRGHPPLAQRNAGHQNQGGPDGCPCSPRSTKRAAWVCLQYNFKRRARKGKCGRFVCAQLFARTAIAPNGGVRETLRAAHHATWKFYLIYHLLLP